ncbi:MAG: TolC family protein [Planctomycetaceae bacterium]|nr:MAG: TolC family protein [Planctomycetaceae bacterium]
MFRHLTVAQRAMWKKLMCLALAGAMLPGCTGADKRLSYFGDKDDYDLVTEYEDKEVAIEHSDVESPTLEEPLVADRPRLVGDRSKDEVRDISLTEAIHLALQNNRILRTRGDFRSSATQVFANADNIPSVYDPAIRDSGVLFGGQGVEAALSAFDPIVNANITTGHSSQYINNFLLGGGVGDGAVLSQDTGQLQTNLTKTFGYGATASVAHNWNYLWTNQDFQLFPSVYTGNILLQYSQPLWAGAGTEFTRIAGPFNPGFARITGVSQGVVISRINTDLVLVDFELSVRNMLKDVEDTYWDLYLAYRTYDAAVTARDSFLESWRFASKYRLGGRFSELDEQQSREAYYDGRSRTENTLQEIYNLETQLRRLCGLPSSDGQILRPSDDPTITRFEPDWNLCLAEALTKREELRKQKWNVKSLELQLTAAESLANPSLNFVSNWQTNGFGNNLWGENLPPGTPGYNLQSAYRTLFNGQQTGWNVGVQFSMPLGFRSALAQVRNYELRLCKAREVLALQEKEISYELTKTFQDLAWRYQVAETAYNRWQTAEAQIPGRESRYKLGVPNVETSVLLDQFLQTRRRAAEAEVTFYSAVIEYNKALLDLQFRKGTLLEVNNIHLAEGAWTAEAQKDAIRRAWARTFAFDAPDIDPVHSEPENFVDDLPPGELQFAPGIGQTSQPYLTPDGVPPAPTPSNIRSKSGPLMLPGQSLPEPAPLLPAEEL